MLRFFPFKLYYIVEASSYERVFSPLMDLNLPFEVKTIRLYKIKNRYLKQLRRLLISIRPRSLIVCCTAGRFIKPIGGYRIQIFHAPASFGASWDDRYLSYFDVICPATFYQETQVREMTNEKICLPVGLPYLDGIKGTEFESIQYDLCYAPTYHRDISSIFEFLDVLMKFCIANKLKLLIRLHPFLYDKDNEVRSGGIDWKTRILEKSGTGLITLDVAEGFSNVMKCRAVITDTSGLAFEYSALTGRPIGFVGTKLKVPLTSVNKASAGQDYNKVPEISSRGKIGPIIETYTPAALTTFLYSLMTDRWKEPRTEFFENYIINVGHAKSAFEDMLIVLTKGT